MVGINVTSPSLWIKGWCEIHTAAYPMGMGHECQHTVSLAKGKEIG